MSGWAIAGLILMAVIYGGAFPIAWIIANRETKRRMREMDERWGAVGGIDRSPSPWWKNSAHNPLDGTRLWDNS